MIERDELVEEPDSLPLARHFAGQVQAQAYLLGLEDAVRIVNIDKYMPHLLRGHSAYASLRGIMEETCEKHNLVQEPTSHLRSIIRRGTKK